MEELEKRPCREALLEYSDQEVDSETEARIYGEIHYSSELNKTREYLDDIPDFSSSEEPTQREESRSDILRADKKRSPLEGEKTAQANENKQVIYISDYSSSESGKNDEQEGLEKNKDSHDDDGGSQITISITSVETDCSFRRRSHSSHELLDSVDVYRLARGLEQNSEAEVGREKAEEEKRMQEARKLEEYSWQVNEEDEGKFENEITSGRYFLPRDMNSIVCYNCEGKGHLARDCPKEKKRKPCFLCGGMDHNRNRCPWDLCFLCQKPGHQKRDCRSANPRRQYCERCRRHGHLENECHEIWRQYHMTCFPDRKLRRANLVQLKASQKASCYNCGANDHFGHACHKPYMDGPCHADRVACPFVYTYDHNHNTVSALMERIAQLDASSSLYLPHSHSRDRKRRRSVEENFPRSSSFTKRRRRSESDPSRDSFPANDFHDDYQEQDDEVAKEEEEEQYSRRSRRNDYQNVCKYPRKDSHHFFPSRKSSFKNRPRSPPPKHASSSFQRSNLYKNRNRNQTSSSSRSACDSQHQRGPRFRGGFGSFKT